MFRKKDDVYITLFKYCRQQMSQNGLINRDEAVKHAVNKNPGVSERAIRSLCSAVLSPVPGSTKDGERILATGAYFNLLEHEELHDARQASNWARMLAIAALGVPTAAVIVA